MIRLKQLKEKRKPKRDITTQGNKKLFTHPYRRLGRPCAVARTACRRRPAPLAPLSIQPSVIQNCIRISLPQTDHWRRRATKMAATKRAIDTASRPLLATSSHPNRAPNERNDVFVFSNFVLSRAFFRHNTRDSFTCSVKNG